MTRWLIITASVLLFLVLILAALWNVLDWPPLRLILKYGLPEPARLTGRNWTGKSGMTFVEVEGGYCLVDRWAFPSRGSSNPGSALRHFLRAYVPLLMTDRRSSFSFVQHEWVEAEGPFWISCSSVEAHTVIRYIETLSTIAGSTPHSEQETVHDFLTWLSVVEHRQLRLASYAELELAARAKALKYADSRGGLAMFQDGGARRTYFGAAQGDVSEGLCDVSPSLMHSWWPSLTFVVWDPRRQ
jgi:hypothetical protein